MLGGEFNTVSRSTLVGGLIVVLGFVVGLLLASVIDPGSSSERQLTVLAPATCPPANAASALRPDAESTFHQQVTTSTLRVEGTVAVTIAPAGGGGVSSFGSAAVPASETVIAMPVVAALLATNDGRPLTTVLDQLARQAIVDSDPGATDALFGALAHRLGGAQEAAQIVLAQMRGGGHGPASLASPVEATYWPGGEAVTFLQALARGCLPYAKHYLMELLDARNPTQQYGLAVVRASTPSLAFTGSAGSHAGGHYAMRQDGFVGTGASTVAVTLIANPARGQSTGAGSTLLDAAARWLVSARASAQP